METNQTFPYDSTGCEAARNYLLNCGYSTAYFDRYSGWEIVLMANKLLSEQQTVFKFPLRRGSA